MEKTNEKTVKRPPFRQEAKIKTMIFELSKLHRRNYENTKEIWRNTENTA